MGKLLILLVLILAGFMALAVWLYNTFGLWGFLGAVAAFAVFLYALKVLVVWGLHRLFMLPVKMKSAVLKDAQLEIHSISAADAPPRESSDDADSEDEEWPEEREADDDEPRSLTRRSDPNEAADDDWTAEEDEADEDLPQDWYFIDATITPKPPQGKFRHWEPGDLALVPPDAAGDDLEVEDLGRVEDIEIFNNGTWQTDDCCKYEGPLRLKLRVGVSRGTRQARFKYYFETFGEVIDFPAPIDV